MIYYREGGSSSLGMGIGLGPPCGLGMLTHQFHGGRHQWVRCRRDQLRDLDLDTMCLIEWCTYVCVACCLADIMRIASDWLQSGNYHEDWLKTATASNCRARSNDRQYRQIEMANIILWPSKNCGFSSAGTSNMNSNCICWKIGFLLHTLLPPPQWYRNWPEWIILTIRAQCRPIQVVIRLVLLVFRDKIGRKIRMLVVAITPLLAPLRPCLGITIERLEHNQFQ